MAKKFRVKAGGFMLPVAVVAGAKAGQIVLSKLSAQSKIVRVGVVAAAGILLSRSKNELAKGAGLGMVAAAGNEALSGSAVGFTMFNNPAGAVMGNQYTTPTGSI